MRFHGGHDLGDLAHHRLVDVKAARGVHDDRVAALERRRCRDRRDVARDARGVHRPHRNAELLAEGHELVDRRGAVDVGRDEQRLPALLAKHVRELRGRRRLARALQAREHHHRRRALRPRKRGRGAAEHLDDRVVHDLHDLLRAGDRLEHALAEGALANGRDKLPDHFEIDVGLEQRDPDVAQSLVKIAFAHARTPAQALERAVQPVGKLLEHLCRA